MLVMLLYGLRVTGLHTLCSFIHTYDLFVSFKNFLYIIISPQRIISISNYTIIRTQLRRNKISNCIDIINLKIHKICHTTQLKH